MIEIRDMSFSYPARPPIFRQANWLVPSGERLGLCGANGCGKTTLFHILTGFLIPSKGKLTLFGCQRRNEDDFHEVREKAGLLFQNPDHQLFYPTVREDIAFGPLNLGKTGREAKRIVREVATPLGLTPLLDRSTIRLSWGEKRLASLAAVLAMQPELLLLDEPSEGLDTAARRRVIRCLDNWPGSLIVASHDEELLGRLCRRRYVIEAGKLRAAR